MGKKKRSMPGYATLETQIGQIVEPKSYVFSVWAKMRRKQHEVRLILGSDPRWPDYAIYESVDDPEDPEDENDYGPTVLMYLCCGKTHDFWHESRYDEDFETAYAYMNWHQVNALYGDLVADDPDS